MVARAARGAAAEAGGPRKERARGVPAPPAAAPETGRSRCPRDWAGGLPTELLEKVARAVPAGDRLCLRLVCKSWAAAGAEIAPAAGEKPLPPGKVTRAGWSDAAASVARAEMVLGGPEERKTKEKLKRGLCQSAAKGGQLDLLKWARARGYPWCEKTCHAAAENGHLEVLQWARAHGCPWDEETCTAAAKNGHLEVLQWARANGCPFELSRAELSLQHLGEKFQERASEMAQNHWEETGQMFTFDPLTRGVLHWASTRAPDRRTAEGSPSK